MELFVELAQYGSTGVAIGSLLLIYIIVKIQSKKDEKVLNLFENHINHNTEALTKLNEKIKQGIEIDKETYKLLRNFNNKGR